MYPSINYFPLYSGDIASIKCQPSRAVNIENMPYNYTICEASMLSKNDQISDKQICERSFTCSIENSEKTGSIDVNLGNIIPSDDKTVESHGRKCRSAQKQIKKEVTPTLNPTYDLTGRPNSEENRHQANVMNDPEPYIFNIIYSSFDSRTDDISYAKVNKLRHKH
ncbi:unnamed protein product [Mytilus edulis]|uniref:Uncharacterized protein n=1 Tax=Mytilus edulis TaxID=6550 RepID=A0A8S3QK81_MYTED|nr:unnamed protein product [Mytilus edulis]